MLPSFHWVSHSEPQLMCTVQHLNICYKERGKKSAVRKRPPPEKGNERAAGMAITTPERECVCV